MSLAVAIEAFLQDRATYCSDATVFNYSNSLRYFENYCVDYFKLDSSDIRIDEIQLQCMQRYSIYLKGKDKVNNLGNVTGKISSRTRKDYLKDVKCFMTFCFDNGYSSINWGLNLKLPRVYEQPIEVLTASEVELLDAAFDIHTMYGSRNLAIIHCMLDAGMRSGEVRRLRIQDLHFGPNYISIFYSKGGKGRNIPLGKTVEYYIQYYLQNHRPKSDNDFVFVGQDGAPITQSSVKCMFDRLKVRANVPRLYAHLLRHTFATSFVLGGGNLEYLRVYLGHSSLQVTEKYLHIANNLRFLEDVYPIDPVFYKKCF